MPNHLKKLIYIYKKSTITNHPEPDDNFIEQNRSKIILNNFEGSIEYKNWMK